MNPFEDILKVLDRNSPFDIQSVFFNLGKLEYGVFLRLVTSIADFGILFAFDPIKFIEKLSPIIFVCPEAAKLFVQVILYMFS